MHSVHRIMPFSCECPVAGMHRFSWPMKQTRAAVGAVQKKHAISQAHTRTVHSGFPKTGPPGSPLFVLFSLFLISLILWLFDTINCVFKLIKWFTHTTNIDTLYSNKGLDVEISSSNTPQHDCINTLKCIEWQRPDDSHYQPKHVVFLSKNITSN